MDNKNTLLIVGAAAVGLFFVMSMQRTPQTPIVIQQPAPAPAPARGGMVEGILGGIGQVVDGIIEITK